MATSSPLTSFDAQAGRDTPDAPALTQEQAESDDQDVITAVRGLATIVADVDDLQALLTQIAHLTVDSVPGAAGGAVTIMRLADDGPPKVLAWAATDAVAREVDHLQYEIVGEGPCLTAMQTRRPLVSGSLGSDRRWPRFGGRVARMQVHSALSVPLIVREAVVGALNIYANERDVFGEHAVRLAEQFGRAAAVTVANVQALQAAHTRAEQLQTALTSRAVIDQAVGIIRSRSGGTEREAFGRLREISQAENVKLAVVAERLVDEAVRRAHARHYQS